METTTQTPPTATTANTAVEGERVYNRRVTDQLLYYWLMKKGKRPYPPEAEIRPDDLPEAWRYCFLIQRLDVEKGGVYNYSYLGDAIKQSYKIGVLEEGLMPMVSPKASLLHAKFVDVLRTGKPLIEAGEGMNLNKMVAYRQCFLPLGEENAPPDFIIGCVNYKIVKT